MCTGSIHVSDIVYNDGSRSGMHSPTGGFKFFVTLNVSQKFMLYQCNLKTIVWRYLQIQISTLARISNTVIKKYQPKRLPFYCKIWYKN